MAAILEDGSGISLKLLHIMPAGQLVVNGLCSWPGARILFIGESWAGSLVVWQQSGCLAGPQKGTSNCTSPKHHPPIPPAVQPVGSGGEAGEGELGGNFHSRGQYMYVMAPARTVVAYKKQEEGAPQQAAAPPPPAVAMPKQ